MAIYHLSVKIISRSKGRSATAAASYRAGVKIHDTRTGETHDYTRKSGVEDTAIFYPENVPHLSRAELWNLAERSEKRKDACVAREIEVALINEFSPEQNAELVFTFAQQIASAYGCAVDVAIHYPKNGENPHAHILMTTRRMNLDGTLGAKTRELDDRKLGPENVLKIREHWAVLTNHFSAQHGIDIHVDHRSLKDQGITDRLPTIHLGPAATGYERRTGEPSRRRLDWMAEASQRLAVAAAAGEAERAAQPPTVVQTITGRPYGDLRPIWARMEARAAKAKPKPILEQPAAPEPPVELSERARLLWEDAYRRNNPHDENAPDQVEQPNLIVPFRPR